jgi:hypothetical protein
LEFAYLAYWVAVYTEYAEERHGSAFADMVVVAVDLAHAVVAAVDDVERQQKLAVELEHELEPAGSFALG